MMKINESTAALILAAGESKRMNWPKSLLPFDKDRSFIDKIIDEYENFGINKIVITSNSDNAQMIEINPNVQVIKNEHPEYERFYSIKIGLEKVGDCQYCFIQNVDNPFICETILNVLFENRINNGCAIPVFQGKGGHPVLIGDEVITKIAQLNQYDLNFKDFLKDFPANRVEVDDDTVLININSPEDYNRYFN
jgi:molybdenum cofactor cytidylyltransferase